MGTWGVGILSNDIAADLKDEWKYHLGEGHTPEEVSQALIEFANEDGIFDDEEEAYDFWLSFALIQWKTGRLQLNVKNEALKLLTPEIIEKIEKLRWFESPDYNKRLKELDKLRETLLSEQPTPKSIPAYFHRTTTLIAGDVFTVKLNSGNYVILEIIKIETGNDYGHEIQTPKAILYDYFSPEKPTKSILSNLPVVTIYVSDDEPLYSFTLWATSKRYNVPTSRIEIIHHNTIPSVVTGGNGGWCFWKDFDNQITEWINKNVS